MFGQLGFIHNSGGEDHGQKGMCRAAGLGGTVIGGPQMKILCFLVRVSMIGSQIRLLTVTQFPKGFF